MSNISIAAILELPVQERIKLVELIWDSVAAESDSVEITPELRVELDRRLADFEANPEAGPGMMLRPASTTAHGVQPEILCTGLREV